MSSPDPKTWIACFRLNTISIAAERARLPHLWGEPFALAAADNVLVAVSPECFPHGIKAGQSAQAARAMCQALIVMPYDRDAYTRAAESIWDMIAVETSIVEPVRPETVFAEFVGLSWDVCHRIKDLASLISSTAMIDVRVGIGATKLVAEQAAAQERRTSPIAAVKIGNESSAVAKLPISSLKQIDLKLARKLEKLGVRTLGDVAALPDEVLHRKLKDKWHILRQLAAGRDGDRVRALWPKPRVEATYRFDGEDEGACEPLIANAMESLAEQVAAGIQKRASGGQCYCRTLGLLVELSNGQCLNETERLVCPTHDANHLCAAAQRLLGRIRSAIDKPISTLVLTASDLDGGSQQQLAMAVLDKDAAKRERQAALDSILSRLWRKYGPSAVISARLLSQAKRIHLWTHVLAKARSEPIRVYTDRGGRPVRYLRQSGCGRLRRSKDVDSYEVAAIIDNWHETTWRWGELIERDCWRVQANPDGIHELHRLDSSDWILEAEAD